MKKGNFYCFSPLAMIVTACIELGLIFYTLLRYKISPVVRVAVTSLFLLAIFQIAEYNNCGRSSDIAHIWTRIGYVAITLLPALALNLIYLLVERKRRVLVRLAYATSLVFALAFGLSSTAFAGNVCAGNYAIFKLTPPLGGLYFTYYYIWLIVGIGASLYFGLNANEQVRRALTWQVAGYLSFLIPTGIVNAVNPNTISAIPSVMCGFAVLYALILVFAILPSIQSKR